jgi:hypothetical protein
MSISGSRRAGPAATAATVLLAAGVLLLSSCSSRPRAPVLRNDPVYQNDSEGFRFLVPEGWIQSSRSNLPPGKVDRERPLVDYNSTGGPGIAAFRVSVIDLPEYDSADMVAKLLATPSFGVKEWRKTGALEHATVGGLPGIRYLFRGVQGKEHVDREVVSVHRDGRFYFFAALYPAKGSQMPEQFHRLLDSVIWKK